VLRNGHLDPEVSLGEEKPSTDYNVIIYNDIVDKFKQDVLEEVLR
jgi:hypothetical protein